MIEWDYNDDEIDQAIIDLWHAEVDQIIDLDAPGGRAAKSATTRRQGLDGLVDWSTLHDLERDAEWVCEPVIPAGRAVLIIAAAKAGKSELAFAIALAVALGRPFCRIRPTQQSVMYVDAEMGPADLAERVENFGVRPTDLAGRMWYYQGPQPPFDSSDAAANLVAEAVGCGAKLVILDTFRRLSDGDENDATTVARWYQAVVAPLIRLGIAVLVLHHLGKDPDKGGRGSSEFTGWPDVVWKLRRIDLGCQLTVTHKRVAWVDDEITFRRTEDPVRFERTGIVWRPGTIELAERLAALGVPRDATTSVASAALKAAGSGARRQTLQSALRYLKTQEISRISDPESPDEMS